MSEALPEDRRRWIVFDYERNMFFDLLALYESGFVDECPGPAQNAIAESLALHTRILCELALKTVKRSHERNDILLRDLLPGFDLPGRESLGDAYKRGGPPDSPEDQLHTRLAHATIQRGNANSWGIVLNPVWKKLIPCLQDIQRERYRRGEQ